MNLDQVVQRAKSDIAKGYVYVMMPIPQIETLLAGLEEQQREIDKLQSDFKALKETDAEILQAYINKVNENYTLRTEHAAMKEALEGYALMKMEGARYVLSTLTKEESA